MSMPILKKKTLCRNTWGFLFYTQSYLLAKDLGTLNYTTLIQSKHYLQPRGH